MKCKKCGAEIPIDKLYCMECGTEVSMVPLFEPEIESQLDENLHRISNELFSEQDIVSKRKKKSIVLVVIIILVIISLMTGIYSLYYLFSSPIYQMNRGNRYVMDNKYKEAIHCYKNALERNPEHPVDIYLYLVNCYEKLGYDGECENYLIRAVIDDTITEEQEMTVYSKLIKLYEEGNSYQTIHNLLKNCKNDNIKKRFGNYLVHAPRFSYSGGTYNEIIPLKIFSDGGHQIYYSFDSLEPDLNSIPYTQPIFLEDGVYEISAVCVDEHGVRSDIVTENFIVNFATR